MIKDYFKQRGAFLSFYLLLWIVFPLVQYLFNFPVSAVLYSMYLISFFFVFWLIYDIVTFHKKAVTLKNIKKNISQYPSAFPKSQSMAEEQYKEIIDSLYKLIENSTTALEKSYNEQNEYYTMWVHQIKTPISAMRLALESDKSVKSETKLLLEQEIFKIEQYIEMALQYVKMQEISSDTVIEKYNLYEIVKQSVRKYAPLFIYKKLSVEIDENLNFDIYTDSKWFSFITEQLLSNAIKYTNEGGIKLYAKGKTLVIEDSGIGILPNDIERIFEKGYTGYNGRIDKKASGIGLYLVKKISKQLAVKIHIESSVGKGTCVFVSAPDNEMEIFDNLVK